MKIYEKTVRYILLVITILLSITKPAFSSEVNFNANDSINIYKIKLLINRKELDSALTIINKEYELTNNGYKKAIYTTLKARLFEKAEIYDKSGTLFENAYSMLVDNPGPESDSIAWQNLTDAIVSNSKSSNHKDNERLFSKADSILAAKPNDDRKAYLFNIKSIIYKQMGMYSRAMDIIDSSITINKRLNDYTALSFNYINKGNIYYAQRDFNTALNYYNKGYETDLSNKPLKYRLRNSISIAAALHMKEDLNGSLKIYNNILRYRSEMSNEEIRAIYYNLYCIYREKLNWDKTIMYLDSTIIEAKKSRDYRNLTVAYYLRAETLGYLNDYKNAFKDYRNGYKYKDSINKQDQLRTISRIELNNQLLMMENESEKIREVRSNLKDNYRTNLIIWVLISVVVLLTILAILIYENRLLKKSNRLFIKATEKIKGYHKITKADKTELNSVNTINDSLKNDLSRVLFIQQESLSIYKNILSQLSKEKKLFQDTKAIESSIINICNLIKDSDIVSSSINTREVDLKNKIIQRFPELTKSEVKLCVLIRLQFSTKEISNYTNTAVRSVEVSKYRLRKKLGFDSLSDLNKALSTI
jgi:tetratricopeptide (TPR) repeat protein